MSTAVMRRSGVKNECLHGMESEWCALCNPTPSNTCFSISSMETKNPSTDTSILARMYLNEIEPSKHETLLIGLLSREFESARRNRIRQIEEKASTSVITEIKRAKIKQDFRLFSNRPWAAPRSTVVSKEWMKVTSSKRNQLRAASDPEFSEYLRFRNDSSSEVNEADFALWRMNNAFEGLRQATRREVQLELTAELLQASFAVGEGRQVSWGDATVNDHLTRIQLLLSQAGGNVSTANRHKAAIHLLQKNGVKTLNEVKPKGGK